MTQDDTPDNLPRMGVDITQIQKDLRNDRPRVSEAVFIQRLLPLFLRKADDQVDLGVWMEYANTMTTALDVIGPSGDVLFTAPAPLRPVIKLHKRNQDDPRSLSLLQIVEQTKIKANVIPVMGDNYLQQQMDTLEIIDEVTDESEQQWVEILRRYGYLPAEGTQVDTAAPQASTAVFGDEDDDF